MKRILGLSAALALVGLFGCATHSGMRGTVAMKMNDKDAHVCMGNDEVKAGDKVALFKNECTGTNSGREGGGSRSCKKVKLGEGEVTRTLNEHYSEVRVNDGVKFEEGTVVEKL